MVQEDGPLLGSRTPLRQVAVEGGGGLGSERHLALLLPLAAHADPALGPIDILEAQPHQFAHAQAAAIKKLENGAVAGRMRALELVGGHCVDQSVHLLRGHHVGQGLGGFGRAHQARGVHGDQRFARKKAEQRAHRRQFAPDGHGTEGRPRGPAVKVRQPLADFEHAELGEGRRFAFGRREVFQKLAQVAAVGLQRVRRGLPARQFFEVPSDLEFEFRHARADARPWLRRPDGRLPRGGRVCRAAASDGWIRRVAAAGRK